MIGVLGFWLALWIPGYALYRHHAKDDSGPGLPGSIGIAYLFSFVALTPIAVLGYLFRWPITVLSWSVVVAALGGSAYLVKNHQRPLISRSVPAFWIAGGLIIGVDLLLGGLAGAYMASDADFHVARIRMLVDHGFNNLDPYLTEPRFSRVYHTNIYHALLAACSQLTSLEPPEVWSATLVWAKLVQVGGAAYLSYGVFRNRIVSLLSGILILLWHAPVTFLVYPNRLVGWPIAMSLAFALECWRSPTRSGPALRLGMAVLVLSQLHSLYALIVGAAVGPLLAFKWLASWKSGTHARVRGAFALLAVTVSLPFLLVTKYVDVPDTQVAAETPSSGEDEQEDQEEEPAPNTKHAKGFIFLENGSFYVDPSKWWNPAGYYPWLLAALALSLYQRRQIGVIAGAVLVIASIMHIPPLCTIMAEALGGRPWAVGRFGALHYQVFFALAPGAFLSKFTERLNRTLFAITSLIVVVAIGMQARWNDTRWGWPYYLESAARGNHRHQTDKLQRQAAFLRRHIPAGSSVLATPSFARRIVMLHDCYVIAAHRGSPGVKGMARRQADLEAILDQSTPRRKRDKLLERYGVRHVVVQGKRNNELMRMFKQRSKKPLRGPGLRILQLRR